MQEGGKQTNSQWASTPSPAPWFEEDDGGWKEGPPATGSGWTDPSPAANDRGQNIGTWHNPSKDCEWSQSSNVIVDSSDKEAWPSIGNTETAGSDAGDDAASVKSGSVISSSSSHGQNMETNQGLSVMQSQSASSPWGANATLGGLESNPWGISDPPSSSAANMNPMSWGSTNPHPSLSMNNQGHNMQAGTSIAGSDTLSNSLNSNPSTTRSGWGVGAPGQGSPRPQNSMQMQTSNGNNMHGLMVSSGAQQGGPPASGNQSGPSNNQISWQGSGSGMFGMSGYSKAPESGWNTPPTSTVMNNVGKPTPSGNNGGPEGVDSGTSVWGSGSQDMASKSGFAGAGGWGEPPPSTPQAAAQWDSSSKSQWGDNPNGAANSQGSGNNTELISWAQAACKGLNTGSSSSSNSGNGQSIAADGAAQPGKVKDVAIRLAIENHDGWGAKPVKQDTAWDVSDSPKTKRKFSTDSGGGASNVWNNNNGTAIWEASRDNCIGGGNGGGNGGGSWNGAAGGGQWQNENHDSNTWVNPGAKPGENQQWAGSGGNGGGSDKTIGTWGGGQDNSQSNMWGNKTETGSWGEAQQQQQQQEGGRWDNPGAHRGVDNGTGYWGADQRIQRPQAWNSQPSTPATPLTPKPEVEPWNKVPPPSVNNPPPPPMVQGMQGGAAPAQPNMQNMPNMPKGSGWGDPSQTGDKVDDGTSIWAANAQQQARASGWGDPGNQWNPTPGAKPTKSLSTSSWDSGGGGDPSWNMRKSSVWPDENGSNSGNVWGGDTEVGYWNDISQESSTWSSAPGWKSKKNLVKGPPKFPTGSSNHPQMRSRLLQQLMDMGFKKEEAQNALISNNMNVENALADLMNGAKKDPDMDVFMSNGAKPRMPGMMPPDNAMLNDDISDTQSESNPHVPNINMQNTPFQNAQVPNQPFVVAYDRSKPGPSLPQSSLNSNNPSINPQSLQQKLMQHKRQQQQMSPTQGPMARGQMLSNQQVMQHQMAQQQILQQLRLAVQSGLISPQLLNQQLPHNILLLLQQLLQLQNVLQQLVTKQQFHQQNKVMNMMQRQQVDQLAVMINNIKQQILQLQKQLSQAQQILLKNPGSAGAGGPMTQNPSSGPHGGPDSVDPIMPIQNELEKLAMNPPQVQQTSRLTQWKRQTPEKETAAGDAGENLNKAVGSKPMHPQSAPSLGPFSDLSGLNISGDTTWSTQATTSSQNWPSTSSGGTTSQAETKDIADMKESLTPATTSSTLPINLTDNLTDIHIPEFIPGKPWQGLAKTVEDDPHITPGSISRSLSVNVVKDDSLYNLATNIKTSPGDSSTTWSMKGNHTPAPKQWSDGAPSMSDHVWRMPSKTRQGPPPGLKAGNYPNRQNSWAGRTDNSAFTPVNTQWDGRAHNASTWLVLRNLTPQIDGSTLRTLCQQHGPLRLFYLNNGQAVVCYNSKEEAAKAQKALNTCVLGNTTILAEFVSDQEGAQFVDQHNNMSSSSNNPSHWSQGGGGGGQQQMSNMQPPSQQPGSGGPPLRAMHPQSSGGGSGMIYSRSESTPWNSGSSRGGSSGGGAGGNMWSSSLWGGGPVEDHNSNPFLSNILGGESM